MQNFCCTNFRGINRGKKKEAIFSNNFFYWSKKLKYDIYLSEELLLHNELFVLLNLFVIVAE